MLHISNITLRASALPIKAELSGSRSCSAAGLSVDAYAPVCALARQMIRNGFGPERGLEVHRGSVLCFVTTLATAAALTVEDGPDGVARFRPYRPPGLGVAPPIASSAPVYAEDRPGRVECAGAGGAPCTWTLSDGTAVSTEVALLILNDVRVISVNGGLFPTTPQTWRYCEP